MTEHVQKDHPSIYELLEKDKLVNHSDGVCPKCSKSFVNKYYLPTHIKKCKGASNPAQCEYCERVFSSPQARNRHKQHCKVLKELKKTREDHKDDSISGDIPTTSYTNISEGENTPADEKYIVSKDELDKHCRTIITELLQPAIETMITKVADDMMNRMYRSILVEVRKDICRLCTDEFVSKTKKELIKSLTESLNKTLED